MKVMTESSYRVLFERLVNQFGPHKQWENKSFPSAAMKKDYEQFLDDISGGLGVTRGSIELYIRWALTTQESIPQDQGGDYRVTCLRAKYHAFEAGFIDRDYIVMP